MDSRFLYACCILLLISVGNIDALTKPTSIKLENNEYTGVVVAIHPNTTEDSAIIDKIKDMFTEASSYLYRATKQRAYFKTVTILLPDTWNNSETNQTPKNATFEGADVVIAPRNPRFGPNPMLPSEPYTKHFEGCGKQAVHIHFTKEFLLDAPPQYGSLGRILVHEWGHYRWGLFNEYPDVIADNDHAEQYYYSPTKETFEATRCTNNGWVAQDLIYDNEKWRVCRGDPSNGYEPGCVSVPETDQPNVKASIMYGSMNIKQVVEFCDSEATDIKLQHNAEAPHKHNRLCDNKGSWDIMRKHPDFNGTNLPRNITDVTPEFFVARTRPARVVLVLDTSGSMSFADRHLKLADAARAFISSTAIDGSYVGIVDFDSYGKIIRGLTLINSDSVRHQLAESVPENANGGTCIGCGLQKALEVLQENDDNAEGGVVLLITDGQDGNDGLRENMKRRYVSESIVINAVAFSNTAEETLIDLQIATGGDIFFQTDNPGSTGLHDAFLATMEKNVKEYDRRIQVKYRMKEFDIKEHSTKCIMKCERKIIYSENMKERKRIHG